MLPQIHKDRLPASACRAVWPRTLSFVLNHRPAVRRSSASERPADGKPERALRLKVIQPPRIVQELLQRRQNLEIVHFARQGVFQQSQRVRIDVILRRDDLLMQAIDVVRIVHAERRLDNGQLHHELDAGRGAQVEIGVWGDGQLPAQARIGNGSGELLREVVKTGRIEAQCVLANDAVRAGVEEQRSAHDRTHDGNPVLDVAEALEVASGERDGVRQNRHGKGAGNGEARAAQRSRIRIGETLRNRRRNESNRRDGANVEAADVLFASHVEAAVVWNFLAAVARDVSGLHVETEHVPSLIDGPEVFPLENVGDGIDVAPQGTTLESERIVVALAVGGIDGIVHGVVGERGRQRARNDSIQRARSGDAPVLQLREEQRGGLVECRDVRAGVPIGDAEPREGEFPQRIARKHRESGAVLVVVLDELRIDADGLAEKQRGLLGLIETVAAGEQREAGTDGAVEKIRLGKAEHEAPLQVAELCGKRQRLAEAKKVVRLIGEADETAREPAHTSLQTDRLLALFLELQSQIDGAFLGVALDFDGLVRFDLLEVIELVQAQNADFPGALVEELTFVDEQFTPNDLVARGGVAGELDASHVILLLFVEAQREVDDLLRIVDVEIGLGREIDEAVFAVGAGVILHGFAQLIGGENVSGFQGEDAFQRVHFERQRLVRIRADDLQRAHAVPRALFNGNGDVHGFAVRAPHHRHFHAESAGVHVFDDGVLDRHAEIAVVLIEAADAHFQVLIELVAVVRFGHNRNVEEVQRNGVGAVVAHGANQLPVAECMVSREFDFADLDLGAFLDFEDQDHRVAGRDPFILRGDFCKLPPVFSQQFFQDDFGLLDFGGIKLAFHGQTDFAFLEAVQDVGLRDGVNPIIADAPDDGALLHLEDDDLAVGHVGGIFHAQLDAFEELGVP